MDSPASHANPASPPRVPTTSQQQLLDSILAAQLSLRRPGVLDASLLINADAPLSPTAGSRNTRRGSVTGRLLSYAPREPWRIPSLRLSGQGLVHVDPACLPSFCTLESLDLSRNELGEGIILLHKAEEAHVGGQEDVLSELGVGEDTAMSRGAALLALSRIPRLQELDLSRNSVMHLPGLLPGPHLLFPRLTVLDVSHNKLTTEAVGAIATCLPWLLQLDISANGLIRLPVDIVCLTSIEILVLNGNALGGPMDVEGMSSLLLLSRLPRLKELSVSTNAYTALPARLLHPLPNRDTPGFPCLEYLDLSYCPIGPQTDVQPLLRLPRLQYLVMKGTPAGIEATELPGRLKIANADQRAAMSGRMLLSKVASDAPFPAERISTAGTARSSESQDGSVPLVLSATVQLVRALALGDSVGVWDAGCGVPVPDPVRVKGSRARRLTLILDDEFHAQGRRSSSRGGIPHAEQPLREAVSSGYGQRSTSRGGTPHAGYGQPKRSVSRSTSPVKSRQGVGRVEVEGTSPVPASSPAPALAPTLSLVTLPTSPALYLTSSTPSRSPPLSGAALATSVRLPQTNRPPTRLSSGAELASGMVRMAATPLTRIAPAGPPMLSTLRARSKAGRAHTVESEGAGLLMEGSPAEALRSMHHLREPYLGSSEALARAIACVVKVEEEEEGGSHRYGASLRPDPMSPRARAMAEEFASSGKLHGEAEGRLARDVRQLVSSHGPTGDVVGSTYSERMQFQAKLTRAVSVRSGSPRARSPTRGMYDVQAVLNVHRYPPSAQDLLGFDAQDEMRKSQAGLEALEVLLTAVGATA